MSREWPQGLALDIVVRSRHLLVAQAVGEALRRREMPARVVPWERRAVPPEGPGDVVLLVEELESRAALNEVRDMVAECQAPVLVLGARRSRTAWGGALEAGALAVLSSTSSLAAVEEALVHLSAGEPIMGERERRELADAWRAWRAEEEELHTRIASLSVREASVLELLSEGNRVAGVADLLGVSESTVRSQVKSLRRKLGVGSQLAAVAVVRKLTRGPSDDVPSVPSQRHGRRR